MCLLPDTHFGYPGQNAVSVREKSLKPFGYNIGTPLFGAPRKYTGFQGRIPCIDARIGLGTECVSGEGLGEKRSDSWRGSERRNVGI